MFTIESKYTFLCIIPCYNISYVKLPVKQISAFPSIYVNLFYLTRAISYVLR